MVLLLATVGSAFAPNHPVWNPPVLKFLLGAFAFTALMFAQEAARYARSASQAPHNVDFVITFDERVISLANPDGSTESVQWDDLVSVSIEPYEDYYQIWIGPFFVSLNLRDGRLLIPAFAVGLDLFVDRLRDLPGIDRERLDVLFSKEITSTCVLWARESGGSQTARSPSGADSR
jgi:hypothetical protein